MSNNQGIYQIVHKKSGKRYIGSSVNLSRRAYLFSIGCWHNWCWQRGISKRRGWKYVCDYYFGIIEYLPENFPVQKLREREHAWINLVPEKLSLNTRKIFKGKTPELLPI